MLEVRKYSTDSGFYKIFFDRAQAADPLFQLFIQLFIVQVDDKEVFRFSIQITSQLLRMFKGYGGNELRDAFDVLTELGILKGIEKIENKDFNNFVYKFTTSNTPWDYKAAVLELQNKFEWAKADYFEHNNKKFIIFNGKRYYIPTSETRNALGLKLSSFKPITENELEKYPSGGNVNDVFEVDMVRNKDEISYVYSKFTNPTVEIRHVPDQETLKAMNRTQAEAEVLENDEFKKLPKGKPLMRFNKWDLPKSINEKTSFQNVIIHGNSNQINNSGTIIEPVQKNTSEKVKSWYEKWWGIIIVSVIAGVILLVIEQFVK
jgi:hypothetical protein